MEESGRSSFSNTQEGRELRKNVLLAFLERKLTALKLTFNFEAVFYTFTLLSVLTIFVLPLLGNVKYITYIMYFAGFVSLARYTYLYAWVVSWFWENSLGKFLLAVVTPIAAAAAKAWSDQVIREIVQTNPSQFPTAQQALFVYNLTSIFLSIIGTTLLVKTFVVVLPGIAKDWFKMSVGIFDVFGVTEFLEARKPKRQRLKLKIKTFAESTSLLFASVFLFLTMAELDSVFGIRDEFGNPRSLQEEILVATSFVLNQNYAAIEEESRAKFCANLEKDIYVSPASNEVVPSQVVTARTRKIPHKKGRYEYQLQTCKNSNRL